jgi:hypothetical protein
LQEARRYPQALLKALMNITDVRILQFTLTLIEDFLAPDPAARAPFLTRPLPGDGGGAGAAGAPPAPGARPFLLPFLQLVGTGGSGAVIASIDANPYVLEHAAVCASLLLSVDVSDVPATAAMLAWTIMHIKSYAAPNPKQMKVTEVAVTALRTLLRNDKLRHMFALERGVDTLLPLLSARNTQLLYEALFCLWSLSLGKAHTAQLERARVVDTVAKLCRPTMPLKIIRLALALLTVRAMHRGGGGLGAGFCAE